MVHKEGASADEALVILMCFYLGESQEEEDAVIARGQRMLKYIEKYRKKNPLLPDRRYPTAMYKDQAAKSTSFDGAREGIKLNLRGTSEGNG